MVSVVGSLSGIRRVGSLGQVGVGCGRISPGKASWAIEGRITIETLAQFRFLALALVVILVKNKDGDVARP